jgi:hypothetical protein
MATRQLGYDVLVARDPKPVMLIRVPYLLDTDFVF